MRCCLNPIIDSNCSIKSDPMKVIHAIVLTFVVIIIGCKEKDKEKAMTILEAEGKGILFDSLSLEYKSAVGIDTVNSVFKNETDKEKAIIAYQNLLDDFGKFLKKNNFKWPFATTCFQKVFFREDGNIDYFLFNFLGEPPYEVSADQEKKFKELMNEFIKSYKYPVTANMKFAQCGTVVYGMK